MVEVDEAQPAIGILLVSRENRHLLQTLDSVVVTTPVRVHAVLEEHLEVIVITVVQKTDVAGVLVDLPGTENVLGRRAPHGREPRDTLVVGQSAQLVRIRQEMLPVQNVAVGIGLLVRGPRADENLKIRVVSMRTEEVIDRRLGVRRALPALADVDHVHELKRPEKIVHLHDLLVGASKIRDLVVQEVIHRGGLRSNRGAWILQDFSRDLDCLFEDVVHRPGNRDTVTITWHLEGIDLALLTVGFRCKLAKLRGR